jgi:hypothetical protein
MHNQMQDQIKVVLRLLEAKKYDMNTDLGTRTFNTALGWLQRFPASEDVSTKEDLMNAIMKSFSVTKLDIIRQLEGGALPTQNGHYNPQIQSNEHLLMKALPKGGWFEKYAQYTALTESPLSYQIFSSLSVLGCLLGRRVYKDMGFFKVYPNYCVVLIGPTGKVKKTSATDIAKSFIAQAAVCPIMADAVTPESLATALVESGHHFIYAPEFSVLFGKQKYNEGLTTRIIRLLDCPDQFKVRTMARGEEIVENVAITILGASTLSLLAGSTPTEVTSSGFLNRFVLVVENDTERCFPEPKKGSAELENDLLETIRRVKAFSGEMTFSPECQQLYYQWYRDRTAFLKTQEETVVEVMQRSFNHVLRTAMLVHLAECDNMQICAKCFQHSIDMIGYLERSIPQTVNALKQTVGNAELEYVAQQIYKAGGAIDHTSLVRKVSNRMNTTMLKGHIRTLEESGRVKVSTRGAGKYYILMAQRAEEETDASH